MAADVAGLTLAAAVAGAAAGEVPVVVLDVVGEADDVLHATAATARKRASGTVRLCVFSACCQSVQWCTGMGRQWTEWQAQQAPELSGRPNRALTSGCT